MNARIALFGRSETLDQLRLANLGIDVAWLQDPQPDVPAEVCIMAETLADPLRMTRATHESDIGRPVLILRERQAVSSCQGEVVTAAGIGTQVEVLDRHDQGAIERSLRRHLNRSLQRQRFAEDLNRANAGLSAQPAYLPQNQAMVSDLLEALPIAVLAIDRQQRIAYANEAAQQFNLANTDTPGSPWFMVLSEPYGTLGSALVDSALKNGRRETAILAHQYDEHGLCYIECTVLPDSDSSRGCAAVLLLQDVTERHRAEEMRKASLQALEEANQAKSQFLATMSHEIRTPLHAVLALLELHGKSSLDSDQRRQVHMMQQSAESLLGLISDVLDISKIEAGAIELFAESFHLRELVDKTIVTFSSLALNKGLVLRAQCPTGLPAVVGDSTRLRQVLSNLLSNAVKSTDTGSIIVDVSATPNSEERLKLEICVEDTGIGLTNEEQVRIFERFSQTQSSVKAAQGGTGLGLSISRAFIELMGGTLKCDSELGTGSRFVIQLDLAYANKLPRYEVQDKELGGLRIHVDLTDPAEVGQLEAEFSALGCEVVEDDSAHLTVGAVLEPRNNMPPAPLLSVSDGAAFYQQLSRPVTLRDWRRVFRQYRELPFSDEVDEVADLHPVLAGKRLLIAEDNSVNRAIIMHQLSGQSCEVDVVEDGAQALRALLDSKYDLLITDIRMPVMDGHALVEALRKKEMTDRHGHPLPVLAMTASVEKSELERCKISGIDEVLTKPLAITQLFSALQRWLPSKNGVE